MLGAGGHAAVLLDILFGQQRDILGLVSPQNSLDRAMFKNIPLYNDDDVMSFDKHSLRLVNGVGSLPGNLSRLEVFRRFDSLGYQFETIVASTAIVSSYAELGKGVQLMSGVIVQTGARIGNNTIVNTGAIIEHDCHIGINNHIAPGATLSGGVTTGDNVHIGTGANIIQSVKIGDNAVIGAGAVVTKDVNANTVSYPAKGLIKVLK